MSASWEPYHDLRDYIEARDTLYRFAAGQDFNDPTLFASAFAADAVLDFTATAQKLGLSIPIMQGREQIVRMVMAALTPLDTCHSVTNQRITLVGDRAQFTALVEAQHLLKHDHSRRLLLKNIYTGELVREEAVWVIQIVRITNVWYAGEPAVLGGQ